MKRILCLLAVDLALAVPCMAQGVFIGAFGGYTVGRDINESDSGFGVQGGVNINSALAAELSWIELADDLAAGNDWRLESTMNMYALSLRLTIPSSRSVTAHIGGGASLVSFDVKPVLEFTPDDDEDREDYVDNFVEDNRLPMTEMDDTFGYHLCGGISCKAASWLVFFGEYRYTHVIVKGEQWGGEIHDDDREPFETDFEFGLLRAGANIVF